MLAVVYFFFILWSLGWFSFWIWAVRTDLRLVRPGPKADLFQVIQAHAGPFISNTVVTLALWGALPAAAYGAYWLAGGLE